MQVQPKLVAVAEPPAPEGVVIVLHGGAQRGDSRMQVSPTQLSVLRMIPTARAIARAGRRRLAVYRLLNSWRGWDHEHTPLDDAAWAVAKIRKRHRNLSIGLVGHSLGGRAALLAGGQPQVRSVVALNPWVYPTDTVDLNGHRVLIVHGLRDKVASPERAEAVAANLGHTADVVFVTIAKGKHAMLRHGRQFDGLASEFTADALLNPA